MDRVAQLFTTPYPNRAANRTAGPEPPDPASLRTGRMMLIRCSPLRTDVMSTRTRPLTSNGYRLDTDPRRLGPLTPVPTHERGDRDALWERLRRDGYLFLKGFLDPVEVQKFRDHFFSTLADTGLSDQDTSGQTGRYSGGPVRQDLLRSILFGQIVPGSEYHQFCAQPLIADWFGWLYDAPTHLHRRKILRHVRPGQTGVGTATQAHYDLVYLREGTDRLLSMWIPLGDTPLARGPLIYLEQSHHDYRRAEQTGRPMPVGSITADLPGLAAKHDRRWLISDFEAGDVVVHSPYIVHASLDNVDVEGLIRLSTDIRYQRSGDPIDWRWHEDWHEDDGL